jgi:hypothetical protein
MSSYYGVVFPEFWTGETGRVIQASGGKDAQLTALYLMSCRYATMIGLYPLPVRDIRHETGIGQKGLVRAFTVLASARFADYDARTEHVWVREMAKFRLGLQVKALESKDNRVLGIQRLYDRLTENPFLEPFFDRYSKELHLRGKRRSGRPAEPLLDVVPSKGLRSPLQASDQDQGTGIRDQVQGSEIRDQRSATDEDQNKPPQKSRRDSPVEISDEGSERTATDRESSTPRNRQDRASGGPDDHRQRMEGADERTRGETGLRRAAAGHAPAGDDERREGDGADARPAPGPVSADDRRQGLKAESAGCLTERSPSKAG